MPGSGWSGSEGPGTSVWGAGAGGGPDFTMTFNIATTGDTPGVSPEHMVLPAFAGYYAKLTFTTGQPGDSAPGAWLDDNPAAESGRSGSIAMAIAYNTPADPYDDGTLLPAPGGFTVRFRFTPPVHGLTPAYEWTPGTDMYFHASMSSDGHTANPQSMQLIVSTAPIP